MKLTRSHDSAPAAGARRAAVRLQRQRALWLHTPKGALHSSRQRHRREERKARKTKAAAERAAAMAEKRSALRPPAPPGGKA